MRGEEFDDFSRELKQLCASLGKAYTDALVQAYWRALRDVSLEEVQAHVERILLNAKKETKFPRPADLRSTPPTQLTPPSDPAFRDAETKAIRNLDEIRGSSPDEWRARVNVGKLDRIIATADPGSVEYARALCEWREARGIHVSAKEWAAVGGR
jgi:hypothetical protein